MEGSARVENSARRKGGLLGRSLGLFLFLFVFLKWIFPAAARLIVGASVNLPVPGTLLLWYMILITVAFFVYLTSNEEDLREFTRPVLEAIGGRGGLHKVGYLAVLILLPLYVGYQVYDSFVPHVVVPASTRQQHPGMSNAGAAPYLDVSNPHRNPGSDVLAAFAERYESMEDSEEFADARPRKKDLSTLDDGQMKELYLKQIVVEGRQLYQKNCRPCHGTGFDGEGPMARAFKLRPIAFTDPGTIATLVENSVFWRVSEGGLGLPVISTPWDSPMPKWGDELTEDERWKIITAIYHDIGMKPRVLEMKVE